MAEATETFVLGSATTLLSTELNGAPANVGGVKSSVGGTSGLFNNTYGGGGLGGYTLGQFELVLASVGSALSAGAYWQFWFLQTVDGTNYEDGSSSIIPAREPDLIIQVRAVTGAQRIVQNAALAPGNWYVLAYNQSGQTPAATGNTLKVAPYTFQFG